MTDAALLLSLNGRSIHGVSKQRQSLVHRQKVSAMKRLAIRVPPVERGAELQSLIIQWPVQPTEVHSL